MPRRTFSLLVYVFLLFLVMIGFVSFYRGDTFLHPTSQTLSSSRNRLSKPEDDDYLSKSVTGSSGDPSEQSHNYGASQTSKTSYRNDNDVGYVAGQSPSSGGKEHNAKEKQIFTQFPRPWDLILNHPSPSEGSNLVWEMKDTGWCRQPTMVTIRSADGSFKEPKEKEMYPEASSYSGILYVKTVSTHS